MAEMYSLPKDWSRLAIPKWSDAVFKMMTASAHVRGDTVAAFPAVGSIFRRTVRELSVLSANLTVPVVIICVMPVAVCFLCNNNN